MKKITLLFVAVLMSIGTYAQYHITSELIGGNIEDGDEIVVGSLQKADATLQVLVHNDTDEGINIRIKLLSMTNTDGTQTEMCFGGSCLYGVDETSNVAPAPNFTDGNYVHDGYMEIQPHNTNSPGDHFWNGNPGINENQQVVYHLAIQQLNDSGDEVINSTEFTYKYDSTMGVESHQKEVGATIINTIVKDGELDINNQNPVDVQIYNLLGQKVLSEHLDSGSNTINVSNLASQVYLVRFQNKQGQTKTKKIIIK